MPWRCAFESPSFKEGGPDPGLCDPRPCPKGSGSRLYTRPASFVQAPNGQTIGSPSCYIDSTSMIEDHTWKSPQQLPCTGHPPGNLRAPLYPTGCGPIRQETIGRLPRRRGAGCAIVGAHEADASRLKVRSPADRLGVAHAAARLVRKPDRAARELDELS